MDNKDYADALAALQNSIFNDNLSELLTPATEEVSAPVAPQWKPLRVTKNICGSIHLMTSSKSKNGRWETTPMTSDNNSIRLGQQITVAWALTPPVEENEIDGLNPSASYSMTGKDKDKYGELSIGLYRLGTMSNDRAVVTKQLNYNGDYNGKINFYAPKMPGLHVFRIFDAQSKDTLVETLAVSSEFVVIAVDDDVQTTLNRIQEALKDDKIGLAVNMIQATAENVSYSVHYSLQKKSFHASAFTDICNALLTAVDKVIQDTEDCHSEINKIEKELEVNNASNKEVEDASETDADEKVVSDAPAGESSNAVSNKLKECYQQLNHLLKFHTEAYDALVAIAKNRYCMELLHADRQNMIVEYVRDRYSVITQKFYSSHTSLQQGILSELTYVPSPNIPTHNYRYVSIDQMQRLDHIITQKYFIDKMQSPQLEATKETIRADLESLLHNHGVISPSSILTIFGSSKNNFGTNESDLDMCLLFRDERDKSVDKAELMSKVGEMLEKCGDRYEVKQIRQTARIPIVHFIDKRYPDLECDVAYSNPLAVQNTSLLRLYSELDMRVRPLAFIIKHWSKARDINNPGQGSLSSYGFIMLVIHFLQTRPNPILPNLQQLGKASPPPFVPLSQLSRLPPDQVQRLQKQQSLFQEQEARYTITHPLENIPCDTYFFQPQDMQRFQWLKAHCFEIAAEQQSRIVPSPGNGDNRPNGPNTTPLVVLLMEFFRYFAYEFDFRHQVLTLNQTKQIRFDKPVSQRANSKNFYAEKYCWKAQIDRLSISDPFEPWYDVAHVVKPGKMHVIRQEFVVSVVGTFIQVIGAHLNSVFALIYKCLYIYVESLHDHVSLFGGNF